MSKRSENFKKSNKMKNICEDVLLNKEIKDLNNIKQHKCKCGHNHEHKCSCSASHENILNRLLFLLGMSHDDLNRFLIKTINDNFGSHQLVSSKSIKDSEKIFTENTKNLTEEIERAFSRGVSYGSEKKENELKQKYNFVDKNIDQSKKFVNNEKTSNSKDLFKYSSNIKINPTETDIFENFDSIFNYFFKIMK